MADTLEREPPNLEVYEWLQEIAELAETVPATEQEREEATERARELADNVMTFLNAMARAHLEATGEGTGKASLELMAEFEDHCLELQQKGVGSEFADAAAHIDFGKSARGMRILIERGEAEIAHLASKQ